jgi:serine/threonine-protein kinase HipA
MWQATPAYDLLCTQPYAGWDDPMAMNLFGRADRLNRKHFLEAGVWLGLRERAVSNMINRVLAGAVDAPQRCEEVGFTDRQTELLADLLRTRIESLN